MPIQVQFTLNSNFYLKRYLREHSYFYKDLIRNPYFIHELNNLMKEEYHLTLHDKLDKIKDDISMLNTFMDVLK